MRDKYFSRSLTYVTGWTEEKWLMQGDKGAMGRSWRRSESGYAIFDMFIRYKMKVPNEHWFSCLEQAGAQD